MTDSEQIQRWRRQRNLFGVIAVVSILAAMGISLPRVLRTRNETQAANNALLSAQAERVAVQQRIRAVQDSIRQAEGEIRARVEKPK